MDATTDFTREAETLLDAWVGLELRVRQNRFLKGLPFNQMAICNLLAKHPEGMTAADLCRATHLLKSQMNKELSALELKGLITRKTSPSDRRKVLLSLIKSSEPNAYTKEHDHVIELFSRICAEIGAEDALELADLMTRATNVASPLIYQEN